MGDASLVDRRAAPSRGDWSLNTMRERVREKGEERERGRGESTANHCEWGIAEAKANKKGL